MPEEVRNVLYVKKKIIFKDLYNVELSEGFYGIWAKDILQGIYNTYTAESLKLMIDCAYLFA